MAGNGSRPFRTCPRLLVCTLMASARSEPLSIESLLQRQKEEKEAAAKVCFCTTSLIESRLISPQPKFLTKEQRATLAISRRAQELREEREREERSRSERQELEKEAEEYRQRERERDRASRYGGGGGRCQSINIYIRLAPL